MKKLVLGNIGCSEHHQRYCIGFGETLDHRTFAVEGF